MGLWGRRFRNQAEQGEWAEIRFVARAAEQRFRVSKPWGNTAPYDLMVERDGKICRVQVKSTTCRVSSGAYPCSMPSGKRWVRLLEEVDYVVAYVIPLDLWYVIPAGVVKKRKGAITLAPWRRRSKYERYMEAWYLMREWREGEKSAGALKRARNRARVRARESARVESLGIRQTAAR
ncbi:MAG: group I intron-associated PD-(D/E)XK endonuclease [Candidatus Sulfotelmatobacter sp.]